VITMVFHSQPTFNKIGNSLGGPQLCAVSVGDGPLGQEANELFLLFQGQSGWSAWCRLCFQCGLPAGLQGIAPTHNAARMATYAPSNLMKRELLLQERNHTAPTFFQQFRRSVRTHRDTPFQDVSIVLHYLCGSQ
jgi:hypothetical protein